jgi:hypothetical protein
MTGTQFIMLTTLLFLSSGLRLSGQECERLHDVAPAELVSGRQSLHPSSS